MKVLAIFTFYCVTHALRPELDLTEGHLNWHAGTSEKRKLRSEMGSAVQMLMEAADSFFLSAAMQAERAEAESYQVAQGISQLGLPLQERFRIFAVARALRSMGEQSGGLAPIEPTSALEGPRRRSRDRNRTRWTALNGVVSAARQMRMNIDPLNCTDDWNLDEWLRGMGTTLATRAYAGSAFQQRARATLKNYCAILKIAKDKEHPKVNQEDIRRLKEAAAVNTPGQAESLEPVQRGHMHQTSDQKREYHRIEALRDLSWIGTWNADVEILKELYARAMIMSQRLTTLVEFLAKTAEIDWMTVEPMEEAEVSNRVGRYLAKRAEFLRKFSAEYLSKLGQNSKLFFESCWRSFKLRLRTSERQCEEESEKSSRSAAKFAGLPRATSDDAITKRAHRISEMDLTDLNKKSKKVDTAMDNVITNAERGALPEAEAKAKMSDASATAQSLHQRLDEGHLDSIDQAEESIEEVERAVCKTQRRSAVQHLKDVFRQARDAMSGGFKASVPNLGIRGVGMSAINFGGGLEEVVDFRNREIGQFRWGAGFFGPSVGGMGLGGYAGIGWKGYKENWTLQEAHITGIFTAASLTPSFLGLNAGLSITFAIDADNSVPGPWVPEPHGFKYVMMGWSAGASITKAAIPLAVDVGVSYSHYLHSECFGSLKELIKYLWLPVCKDCAGKSEPLTVAALRFGIHAPSFPLISEMAFSLMAAMYDLRIREPGYVSDCSVGSVTMRTDPSHFTRQIGDLMFSNARLLEDLIAKWDGVIDQMAAAEKYNQEFEESREYRKWLEDAKGAFDGCPRWGPISTIQQEETRRTYQDLSDADLQGLCRAHVKNYGLDLKCDEKGTRKSREDRLLRYENLAAGSLSLEAVTRLMREVRSTSDAGQVFAQKRTECMSDAGDSDESECMTSVEALKVLEAKVTRKAIYRMCLNRGLQCDHEPKQKAKGPKSSMKAKACKICDTRVRQKFGKFCTQCDQEHDTQDMAMQVVASMGGGMIGNAGRNGRNKDAFGRCQSNSDCWLLNTKCEGDGDEKSCRCEVGSCFTLVQNPGNPHDGTDLLPVCQTEHGGWREMALNMKRSFLTYRYTLGQMVGKFKTMPSKSES